MQIRNVRVFPQISRSCDGDLSDLSDDVQTTQDYIPVNTVDEDSLKLPAEPPSIKILGFVPSSTIARHLYMDDTFVLLPEPGSKQALGAISSLTRAMRNLDQVLYFLSPLFLWLGAATVRAG